MRKNGIPLSNVFTLTNTFVVLEIVKPTKAKYFEDLGVGDLLSVTHTISNNARGSRNAYVSQLEFKKINSDNTGYDVWFKGVNEASKILEHFVFERI